jgi:hypothetical protein
MNYVLTALANLAVASAAGAAVCYFLAYQRASRLRWQLAELTREIRGVYEMDSQKVFEPLSEKKARWSVSRDAILADVDKGADRFVRLNAQTTHKIRVLFDDVAGSPSILEVLGYESAEKKKKATYEDVVVWIDELRESIGPGDFFESLRGI